MSAPRTADEFYRRGLELNLAGDVRTALDHFLSSFRIAERPTCAISAANMHLKLGERDRARAMYDRAKRMALSLSQEALVRSKLETIDAQARVAPLVSGFLQEVRPDDPRLHSLRTMLSNILNSEDEAKYRKVKERNPKIANLLEIGSARRLLE